MPKIRHVLTALRATREGLTRCSGWAKGAITFCFKTLAWSVAVGGVSAGVALALGGYALQSWSELRVAPPAALAGFTIATSSVFIGLVVRCCGKVSRKSVEVGETAALEALEATERGAMYLEEMRKVGHVEVLFGRDGAAVLAEVAAVARTELSPRLATSSPHHIAVGLTAHVALQEVCGHTRVARFATNHGSTLQVSQENMAWYHTLLRLSVAVYGPLVVAMGGELDSAKDLRLSHTEMFCKYNCLSQDDLLAFEWESASVFSPAFALVRHVASRSFIVALRGTLSAVDVITDLDCAPSDDGQHPGMQKAAQTVSEKVLPLILKVLETEPGWKVTLTGHSLGAGVASLLALTWHGKIPGVSCVGFATPATMTESLSESSQSFVTSIVVGNDVVPSWSLGTTQTLFSCIAAVRDLATMHRIMKAATSRDNIPMAEKQWCLKLLEQTKDRDPSEVSNTLYPPGLVVWLPLERGLPRVVPAREFGWIFMHRHMLRDHTVGPYLDAFRRVSKI